MIKQLENKLIKAVLSKDEKMTANLLMQGANPNSFSKNFSRTYENFTLRGKIPLLIIASLDKKFDIVQALLDAGADINIQIMLEKKYDSTREIYYETGGSAISIACKMGIFPTVKFFLEKGANLEILDEKNCTPFVLAAKTGRMEIVKILLEHGVNFSRRDHENKTPLEIAAKEGFYRIVEILQPLYQNQEVKVNWNNCLNHEILATNSEGVRYSIGKGAEVNFQFGNRGWTPLMLACEKGNHEIIRTLLENGAQTEVWDARNEWTPFLIAAKKGNLRTIKLLLKHGKNLKKKEFLKALSICNQENFPEIIEEIEKFFPKIGPPAD